MLRLLLFLAFHLLSLAAYAGLAAPLGVNNAHHVLGGNEVTYLRDPQGQWTIDDVSGPVLSAQFQVSAGGTSFGYTRDVIWLRIVLAREDVAPEQWSLEVTNPFINDLQLFTPRGGEFAVVQAGDRFPFASRQIAFHHPVFQVALPTTKQHTFYLRMSSDSSLSSQLLLWQPTALRDAGQRELLMFGGVLGMVVMSFLIALVHWNSNRDPALLRLCGLTVVIFGFLPAQLGLWSQFAFMNSPMIADLMVPWTLALVIVTVLLVFSKALGIPKSFPQTDRLLKTVVVLCPLLALTRELDLYWLVGGPLLQIFFICSLLITGAISLVRWHEKVQGAGYFVAAHVVLIGSLLTGRLMLLGVVPVNALTYASWIPGTLAFLLLVHAGIVTDYMIASRERAQAQREAELATKVASHENVLRKDQTIFFSFVAHELRSPLGVIIAGIKNLQRDVTQWSPDTQMRLKRMWRASERLSSLIERNLHLQRLNNTDFVPHYSHVPPREPAIEAMADVQATFADRTFDLLCSSDLPTSVEMDGELIALSLVNLLTNAAKYSPRDDVVQLEVSVDEMLHYRFRDRGPGLSAQEQTRLFNVFQRSPSSRGEVGFGIGLAIVKRVAEVHGGALTYVDRPGGGAQFSLSLPLSPAKGLAT